MDASHSPQPNITVPIEFYRGIKAIAKFLEMHPTRSGDCSGKGACRPRRMIPAAGC